MKNFSLIGISALSILVTNELIDMNSARLKYKSYCYIEKMHVNENLEPYVFSLEKMDDSSAKMETRIVAVKQKPIRKPKKAKIDTFIEPKKISIKPTKLRIVVTKLKDTL